MIVTVIELTLVRILFLFMILYYNSYCNSTKILIQLWLLIQNIEDCEKLLNQNKVNSRAAANSIISLISIDISQEKKI